MLARILDHLGIDTAEAIVGSSYGGMVALSFSAMFSTRVRQLIVISAAHRTHPMATALRSVQRDIVRLATELGAPERGLSLARAIAMTTYRSAQEFEERFDSAPAWTDEGARFPVDDYLRHCGRAFAKRFDAENLLTLSESLDLHAVEPSTVTTPATLVSVDSDTLVPPWLMRQLADDLGSHNVLHEITSPFGHDAFLKEHAAIGRIVRNALAIGGPIVRRRSRSTGAVRAALEADIQHHAVMPPIHLSANFAFTDFDHPGRYDYTRSGNPTRDHLADALTELEGGVGTVVTSSGLGAIMTVLQLLGPRDTIVAPHDCYGGTRRLLDSQSRKGCFRVSYVDQTDPVALTAALGEEPAIVLVETPSNPLLRITDLALVAGLTHDRRTLFVADNTFMSPALQRPIEHGADIVVHSTTKFLNGHSDVVGGAIVSANDDLHDELAWWANCMGITGCPFDSYLTLRGLRTLYARTAIHQSNAARVVEALSQHPAVSRVYHPSLPNHAGHSVALRQQSGFGSIASFELPGGHKEARTLVRGLRQFTLAESLGGVESLVAHPATMTHASMDEASQSRAGITGGLIRLSVGIANDDDLVDDLVDALDMVVRAT
jgi:cystathionine gamma-synthase